MSPQPLWIEAALAGWGTPASCLTWAGIPGTSLGPPHQARSIRGPLLPPPSSLFKVEKDTQGSLQHCYGPKGGFCYGFLTRLECQLEGKNKTFVSVKMRITTTQGLQCNFPSDFIGYQQQHGIVGRGRRREKLIFGIRPGPPLWNADLAPSYPCLRPVVSLCQISVCKLLGGGRCPMLCSL